IQVKATVKGSTVIGVEITQLDLADNRSQSIADYAVPQLEQQSIDVGAVLAAAVSGAVAADVDVVVVPNAMVVPVAAPLLACDEGL
ncbi:MAG: hypothetical protein H7287_12405, partial [Thermoleophilia bacterium]|nr:hypothetical protein [Thermoleophilia bacterium]